MKNPVKVKKSVILGKNAMIFEITGLFGKNARKNLNHLKESLFEKNRNNSKKSDEI